MNTTTKTYVNRQLYGAPPHPPLLTLLLIRAGPGKGSPKNEQKHLNKFKFGYGRIIIDFIHWNWIGIEAVKKLKVLELSGGNGIACFGGGINGWLRLPPVFLLRWQLGNRLHPVLDWIASACVRVIVIVIVMLHRN